MDKEVTKICPICGKTDIPNFLEKDVVCPCCGADLSVYRKLQLARESAEQNPPKRGKRLAYIIIALLTIVVVFLVCNGAIVIPSFNKELSTKNEQIKSLTTERDSLSSIVADLSAQIEDTRVAEDYYIVKRGDSFCRISKSLYGTELKAQEIAESNDFGLTDILYIGDTLKIKK